jgi:phosphatidyl-myo-inositol dimannoside synthase
LPARIAILTLDFPPGVGGVQRYLYEAAHRLGQRHEVTVLTPASGCQAAELPFRCVTLSSAHPLGFARALRALHPTHIVVGHAHPSLLLAAAVVGRGRYACLTHGNDFLAAQQRWHRALFNRLLAAAQPLITVSAANAARLQQLGLPAPVVIHPGADPGCFTPAPTRAAGPFVLLTVARLVPRKGVDVTLQALSILLPHFPDLRFCVAGDGPERPRLERMAEELGVARAIRFLGRLPDEAVCELYRGADVFVLATRDEAHTVEGFGIVYLEASASGLPVVAARSGGAVEAVRGGVTGLLVPANDPIALARVLVELLADPARRERMGRAGRRWVEEEMNWDRVVHEIEDALGLRQYENDGGAGVPACSP